MADDGGRARKALFKSPDKGGDKVKVKKKKDRRNKTASSPRAEDSKAKKSEAPLTTGHEDPTTTKGEKENGLPSQAVGGKKEEEKKMTHLEIEVNEKEKKLPPLKKTGDIEKNKKSEHDGAEQEKMHSSPIMPEQKNGTTRADSPQNKWSTPPSVNIDVSGFVSRCLENRHLITETGIKIDLPKLKEIETKMMSILLVDRKQKRVVRSNKDVVIKSLASLGVNVEQIVKGDGFALWDILLPSAEDCLNLLKRDLHTRDYTLRVEYLGRRRTRVAVYEVPSYVSGEVVGAFLMKYGDIVAFSNDRLRGEWRFDLMTDSTNFNAIPNYLDIDGRKAVPIIVTGRRPVCWRCDEIGHLAAACQKKFPDPAVITQSTLPSTSAEEKGSPVDPPATWTPKIRSTTGAHLRPSTLKPASPSPQKVGKAPEKSAEDWNVVGKGGRKVQIAGPRSSQAPKLADTNIQGETALSYADKLRGGCASPGKDKFDAARKFLDNLKKKIGAEKKQTKPNKTVSGVTPPSTPVSPKILKCPPIKSTPPKMTSPTRLPVTEPSSPYTPTQDEMDFLPLPPPVLLLPPPDPPPHTAQKRHRSPSGGSSEEQPQKKEKKYRHKRGVHICCVDPDVLSTVKLQHQALRELKVLQNYKMVQPGELNVEDPTNFPRAKKLLTVVRAGDQTSQQVWEMLKEANSAFDISAPLAVWNDPHLKKLVSFCSGRVPVYMHPSLYRAIKLTFPRHVGGVSHDATINTVLGTDPMGPAVGVLDPCMFIPGPRHH